MYDALTLHPNQSESAVIFLAVLPGTAAPDDVSSSVIGRSRPATAATAAARASTSSADHEGESSDTQSTAEMKLARRQQLRQIHDAAFPKESEKVMLLDLLGPQAAATMTAESGVESGTESLRSQQQQRQQRAPAHELTTSQPQQQVQVRRVTPGRYYNSDSSSDDHVDVDDDSAPSSPRTSHRTESEYARSDSMRSSFRSTVPSEGRITVVTDNNSCGVSDVSTAPNSMQNSPQQSSHHTSSSVEQSHHQQQQPHYMTVTSDYSPYPRRKSPTPRARKTVVTAAPPTPTKRSPTAQEPKKSDSKSSADSAIENPSQFSSQIDSNSSLEETTSQSHHSVQVSGVACWWREGGGDVTLASFGTGQ